MAGGRGQWEQGVTNYLSRMIPQSLKNAPRFKGLLWAFRFSVATYGDGFLKGLKALQSRIK